MPELPEVTTTVSGINHLARNLVIKDAWSDWPKLVKSPRPARTTTKSGGFEEFKKKISGLKILGAERRGKNVLIKLSRQNGWQAHQKILLIHMKMTGSIQYGKWADDERKKKFIHLIFFLSDGHQLALSDVRKFAKVLLMSADEFAKHPDLNRLGPEPFDKSLTLKKFAERLNKKGRWPIKQALMNQELIAGIGNIYSDEILWAAGVHPLQKVGEVNTTPMKKIYTAMKIILKKSIQLGGDSTSDYRNIYGERGGFQKVHKVYRKTGENCLKKDCGGKIMRIKVAGRSAHFCSEHQKLL